jgi:glutamate dehydrogenase/leucine dehydrogenase
MGASAAGRPRKSASKRARAVVSRGGGGASVTGSIMGDRFVIAQGAERSTRDCVPSRAMKIAMIGLGRMGANMTRRLLRAGHDVVAFDREPQAIDAIVREGAEGAASLAELCAKLEGPREDSFAAKLIAALRNQFGGHAVRRG